MWFLTLHRILKALYSFPAVVSKLKDEELNLQSTLEICIQVRKLEPIQISEIFGSLLLLHRVWGHCISVCSSKGSLDPLLCNTKKRLLLELHSMHARTKCDLLDPNFCWSLTSHLWGFRLMGCRISKGPLYSELPQTMQDPWNMATPVTRPLWKVSKYATLKWDHSTRGDWVLEGIHSNLPSIWGNGLQPHL